MLSYENGQGFRRGVSWGLNRGWGLRILLIFLTLGWLALVGMEWADAAETGQTQVDDEYSFNWLDPEKKIYVLQNRKYLKAMHPLVSAIVGLGFSNPYRTTYNLDGRFAFYFSEEWGIELFYALTSNQSNNTMQALSQAAPNTLPNVREIRSQYGGMIHFVPWYAKINVFNTILYFDWYFGAGAGGLQAAVDVRTRAVDPPNYAQQNLLGMFFSTGHHYHLSQSFSVRVDVTGSIYQAPIYGTSGESSWYSNYNFGLGIGWRI